ncbi:MAG: GAF domain-containing protein [Aggregatilineales bacterium]
MTNLPSSHQSTKFILEQLKDIAASVMSAAEAGNTEKVLQRIAEVSQELVQAKYAALGVPDGHGSLKYFKVVGITPEEIARLEHYPEGKGLLGAIMNEREILRLENMKDDSRSVGFPANHPKMDNLLGVPIQVGKQLLGMLYLCDRQDGQPFSIEDQWLIETLAGYAALAITGTQLSDQIAKITLLEERERVGMELHDGVIQSLYAVGIKLKLLSLSEKATSTDLDQVIANLDNTIEDIRGYILNLKTATYHKKTIFQSINDTISRLAIPETLKIKIHAPDEIPLFPLDLLESICQIINEAISNTVRHANASIINIILEQTSDVIRVTIEDDGKGFNLKDIDNVKGLGLRNIRQRVTINHGTMRVESDKNSGTHITFEIPIKSLR